MEGSVLKKMGLYEHLGTLIFLFMSAFFKTVMSLGTSPSAVTVLKTGSTTGIVAQTLPFSYIQSLPHWVTTCCGETDTYDGAIQIPMASSKTGFVNPHSFGEVWVPECFSRIPYTGSLALCALLKEGSLRCVFPGVDIVAFSEPDVAWRNWGLSSIPMAQTFLDFATVPLDKLKLSAFTCMPPVSDESRRWMPLHVGLDVTQGLNTLLSIVSDPPKNMLCDLKGFQLLTIPLIDGKLKGFDLEDGRTFRIYLDDYPDPEKLLHLDDGENTGGGFIEFSVRRVSAATDSEYLPDCYRPLYSI